MPTGLLTINDLITRSYGTAVAKGWHDKDEDNIPTKLALIHSEVSEALEEVRTTHPKRLKEWVINNETGKPEGFPIELADTIIRIADLCGQMEIDLEAALFNKLDYNETRPYRHGGKSI